MRDGVALCPALAHYGVHGKAMCLPHCGCLVRGLHPSPPAWGAGVGSVVFAASESAAYAIGRASCVTETFLVDARQAGCMDDVCKLFVQQF